jgi:hypothetical protein
LRRRRRRRGVKNDGDGRWCSGHEIFADADGEPTLGRRRRVCVDVTLTVALGHVLLLRDIVRMRGQGRHVQDLHLLSAASFSRAERERHGTRAARRELQSDQEHNVTPRFAKALPES